MLGHPAMDQSLSLTLPAGRSAAYRPSWLEALPYPARNMLRRWRGMVGMIIGVGIALAIGMTLLGINRAEMDLFTGEFSRSWASLYVVMEGGTMIPILPGEGPGHIKSATATLQRVRAWPEVQSAIGLLSWTMQRSTEGRRRAGQPTQMLTTMGVEGDPSAIPGALDMKQGRWIRRSDETVVGPKLAKQLNLGVNDTLRLNDRDLTVVGIGQLRGLGYGWNTDGLAYLDFSALRRRADVGDLMNVFLIQTAHPQVVQERLADLDTLAVSTPADLIGRVETLMSSNIAIYWIMIALTLAIAGLFVGSMLNHSVAERRVEFGTLRALGLPSRTILLTVAAEAILISVAAGVFAVGLSLFFGYLVNATLAASYGFESLYSADASLFSLIFALALGLGLVAGLLPARRATRVDPIDVLREV